MYGFSEGLDFAPIRAHLSTARLKEAFPFSGPARPMAETANGRETGAEEALVAPFD